jgi:dolichol-phosphate mannosyltransferase
MTADLTLIVPTLNERDNVGLLTERLHAVLEGIDWEVVFVDDDSTDGTLEALKALARKDPRVRFLHRIGRRGLSSACIEGMASSASPYLAVMDADLQHDETLLPRMLETLRAGEANLVVGSRYIEGGGVGAWNKWRRRISAFAVGLGRFVLWAELSDPMSGFFMMRREVFENTVRSVSGMGFKILLDIVSAAGRSLRIKELPFEFGARRHGESKLDTLVAWEFLLLVIQKMVRDFIPARFIMFIIVGSLGAVIHLMVLAIGIKGWGAPFLWAQGTAAAVAMVSNYFVNNLLTYRDLRLRGPRLVLGLIAFVLICSVGAVVNVDIAGSVYERGLPWWIAGLVGAAIGAVWNFAVSSTLVWRRRARRTAQG